MAQMSQNMAAAGEAGLPIPVGVPKPFSPHGTAAGSLPLVTSRASIDVASASEQEVAGGSIQEGVVAENSIGGAIDPNAAVSPQLQEEADVSEKDVPAAKRPRHSSSPFFDLASLVDRLAKAATLANASLTDDQGSCDAEREDGAEAESAWRRVEASQRELEEAERRCRAAQDAYVASQIRLATLQRSRDRIAKAEAACEPCLQDLERAADQLGRARHEDLEWEDPAVTGDGVDDRAIKMLQSSAELEDRVGSGFSSAALRLSEAYLALDRASTEFRHSEEKLAVARSRSADVEAKTDAEVARRDALRLKEEQRKEKERLKEQERKEAERMKKQEEEERVRATRERAAAAAARVTRLEGSASSLRSELVLLEAAACCGPIAPCDQTCAESETVGCTMKKATSTQAAEQNGSLQTKCVAHLRKRAAELERALATPPNRAGRALAGTPPNGGPIAAVGKAVLAQGEEGAPPESQLGHETTCATGDAPAVGGAALPKKASSLVGEAPPAMAVAPTADDSSPPKQMYDPMARAVERLLVHSGDVGAPLPAVVGEYCRVDVGANGRPAWKATPRPGRSDDVFLVWTAQKGGHWVFRADLASDGQDVLARSTQSAVTALPYELMASTWTAASWGQRGPALHLVVVCG